MAAPEPEEPLGEEQVDDNGEVDDEGDELERADAVGVAVDLEGHEGGGGDEREVLGPPFVEPEPDPLDRLRPRRRQGGRAARIRRCDGEYLKARPR